MCILLDECLPARLLQDLPGHDVLTVSRAGWAGIKNGRLPRPNADSANHNAYLTMDKSLPHQQRLRDLPFSVVVLRAKSNRFEDTHPLMSEFVRRLSEFTSGYVYIVPQPD